MRMTDPWRLSAFASAAQRQIYAFIVSFSMWLCVFLYCTKLVNTTFPTY